MDENNEETKDPSVFKESQEVPERRVSFAATARIRVFNTGDSSTSEQETPNQPKKTFENPFNNEEKIIKKDLNKQNQKRIKTIVSSPLSTNKMNMTECVGGIIDKTQKDSFVEQLSPMIVAKEIPERLSWCFNPTETMNITDNVGRILKNEIDLNQGKHDYETKEKNISKEHETFPLIRDIPEPVFEQMNSPFVEKTFEKTPKKDDLSRRRSSIRYSTGSRLDSYPTPLFPRIRLSEQAKVKAPSPCVEETLPEITLKEFLSLIGIRFLDGLTSFTRRDTLLFDKKPDEVLDNAEIVYKGLICTEEHSIYEKGCSEIIEMINESKRKVSCLEKEFGFNRPAVYKQFSCGDETKKDEIIIKLKALKSASRIKAKNNWYDWRMTHCSALQICFDSLSCLIDKETEELNQKIPSIDECEKEFDKVLLQTKNELFSLKEKEEAYHTMDWTRFRELEVLIEKQKLEVEKYEKIIEQSKKEANVVDFMVKEEEEREKKLEMELEECYEICKAYEETSSSIIEKLGLGYSILELVCGWRLTKLTNSLIKLSTNGDIPIDLTVDYAPGFICTNLQIQTTHQDNFTHKCVSILKEEFSSSKSYFPELLQTILKRIDGWSLLRKDLKNARFLSLLSDKENTQKHVYKAVLLQDSFKRRIDVLFDATNYPSIDIFSTEVVYGSFLEEKNIFDLHQKIESELKPGTKITSFLRFLLTIKQ